MFGQRLCAATLLLSVSVTGSALAADTFTERYDGQKPAVSGINGKLEFGYLYNEFEVAPGVSIDGDAFVGQGAISFPVTTHFGLQIDAGGFAGDIGGFDISGAGVGGHFFWRDPDVALVGVYAHYVNTDIGGVLDMDNVRYGVEGELYLNRVSLEGFVGADYLEASIGPFSASDTFFSGEAIAAFYPVDNLRVFAGVQQAFDETSFIAGGEYLFNTGWQAEPAVFARGAFSDDSTSVMAGLKFYFGEQGKSLIRRHREDDPQINLFDNVGAAGTAACGAATPAAPPEVPMDTITAAAVEEPKLKPTMMAAPCAPTPMGYEPPYDME